MTQDSTNAFQLVQDLLEGKVQPTAAVSSRLIAKILAKKEDVQALHLQLEALNKQRTQMEDELLRRQGELRGFIEMLNELETESRMPAPGTQPPNDRVGAATTSEYDGGQSVKAGKETQS